MSFVRFSSHTQELANLFVLQHSRVTNLFVLRHLGVTNLFVLSKFQRRPLSYYLASAFLLFFLIALLHPFSPFSFFLLPEILNEAHFHKILFGFLVVHRIFFLLPENLNEAHFHINTLCPSCVFLPDPPTKHTFIFIFQAKNERASFDRRGQ